jgi:rhamnose utilization protein RhaD (predicted bifunctional aldolase and dehydrogenase)
MSKIQQLIEISRHYGDNPAYVIAGGGNTSYKDDERIWIKASGIPLAGIAESGFVCLSREKLGEIEVNTYSENAVQREEDVKSDMKKAIISPENLRPSVETSLHNLIGYTYVIHTHPTLVNGLMCSNHVKEEVEARFGTDALYVEYTDPGFILFKKVQERIIAYQEKFGKAPSIIFLQNHGVFVGANTVDEIKSIYDSINKRIGSGIDTLIPNAEPQIYESDATLAIAKHYASKNLIAKSIQNTLVDHFSENMDQYLKIAFPFSPDVIVYCKSNYLFIGEGMDGDLVIAACEQFEQTHGYYPKVVIEEKGGFTAIEENEGSLENVLDVYLDLMKISYLTENFGGQHFMTPEQIQFIDNWEVEHYRRKIAKNA